MSNHKTAGAILASAVVLVVGLAATEALAFRMIRNTNVGRFSSGSLVTCDDAGGFVHWANASIGFRHNTANQGSGKGTALANAAASWTNVSGASHNVTINGTTSGGFVTDGTNKLLWATGNGCAGGCLAITALVLASGQVITETDVSFNNAFGWQTDGRDYDTEAVAAHELGHCLGIHHTEVKKPHNRPTMYAAYFGTAGRSLAADDQQALLCSQNRYPPLAQQIETLSADASPARLRPVALAARPRLGGAILRFALAEGSHLRLQVFDVSGRLLATLVDGYRAAGEHEIAWDGDSPTGHVPSGVYFARAQSTSEQARATVILAE